jgi:hypothetical protein
MPGRHPFGMIGVHKSVTTGKLIVSSVLCHSGDRFSKAEGRKLLQKRIGNLELHLPSDRDADTNLHIYLPLYARRKLDNYEGVQIAFDKLVEDERTQGTWARQNKDLIQSIDAIRAEHGCAP